MDSHLCHREKAVDGLSEQSVSLPLQRVRSQEAAKEGMTELQFKPFMKRIATVASTKRIASCPWSNLEQQTAVLRQLDRCSSQHDPVSSTETMEAFHDSEEGINCIQEQDTRHLEVSCRALVPYRHQSEPVDEHVAQAIEPPQFSLPDTEVMLFAINLAIKAVNDRNLFNRKRMYHDTCSNQSEEDVRRPSRNAPKQQHESDSLVFETTRNLVSFAPVGEDDVETSRSTNIYAVPERQEMSDKAIGGTLKHESYKNDIETKAQKRKRKEKKRKRRDRNLERVRETQEQHAENEAGEQVQSKRAHEEPTCETSRECTSTLAAESSSVECIESGERDILLHETNGKRQRIDELTESEIGTQHGESSKDPSHQILDKRSDTHISRPQSLHLPFGTKLSSNVLFSGKTLVSSRKQERPSNSTVNNWKRAPPSHSRDAFLRGRTIEPTATKPSSSALSFRSGVSKHHELHRPTMHGSSSISKEEESIIKSQGEKPGRQPMNVATSHAADPIQVLCTESFLETWGDLVYAVSANHWPQCHSGQSCSRDIRFIDSPLLDGCGVDLELADRGALLLICTSVLDEEAAARDIVVALAELVAADRYVYTYVLLIYDIATTPNVSLGICRLQNAVLQHGRQPPTRVIFKTSTASSLPESLASIIISRETLQTAKSKHVYEDLQNAQFCQQACFLQRLLPSMSGNGAIQCLKLARAITSPADPYFSAMLTNTAIRQQIMMAATSSPISSS